MNDEQRVSEALEATVAPEAEVAETPQEPTEAPTVEETEEPESTEPSQTNEGAEAPEPSEEELDSDPEFDVSQYYNQGNAQIPTSEDGTVDPYQLMAVMEQRLDDKLKFQRQEERTWRAIEKKHPDIRNDKGMREVLLNQRIANAVQGKEANLVKLADQLYERVGAAKSQGRAEANISKKVQKAASLESATANSSSTSKSDERMERIASGDKYAAQDLLGEWLNEGKI